MQETVVFRKTVKGAEEMASPAYTIPHKLRRALILVDGTKDVAELSILIRAGDAELALQLLLEGGYIEEVRENELDPSRVAYVPAANDPEVFIDIKLNAMAEIGERLGAFAEMVNAEIAACSTALDLRLLLRDIEDVLIVALGPEEGLNLARRIGSELIRLVPREE